ncbi:MAG: hypothetical protein R2745_03620 [Vicinamibacterales bacterium]
MSRLKHVLTGMGVCLGLIAAPAGAQTPPMIHSVTLAADTGVLTIAGEHLGPDLQVSIDGLPVTTLPGATDTRVQVQAPAVVLATPGTYRLVAIDPVRKAWDGFIVATSPGAAIPAAAFAMGGAPAARGPAFTESSVQPDASLDVPGRGTSPAPVPFTVIEESASPFRTALGHQALDANLPGVAFNNTAVGYQALKWHRYNSNNTAVGYLALTQDDLGDSNTAIGASTLGSNRNGRDNTAVGAQALSANLASSNTAVGASALVSDQTGIDNVAVGAFAMANASGDRNTALGKSALANVSGSRNIAIGNAAAFNVGSGSDNIVLGTNAFGTAESNTMRLGVPFSGQAGQNRTFIAGIRGTTVTGGEGVYIDANGQLGSGPVVPASNTVGSAQVMADSLTAADLAPNAVGTSELADGSVTVAKVGFTFAGLGANTFTGTQTIGAGSLALPKSTPTGGNLVKNGVLFLHDSGVHNTFLGALAGELATTGPDNTATGQSALANLSTGGFNTATGSDALQKASSGDGNTGTGYAALAQTNTGAMNAALGYAAGRENTGGSYNIYLGAGVTGGASDANTMRLGLPYNGTTGEGQNRTFVAGIFGTQLTAPAQAVFVDANGQLGIVGPQVQTGGGTTGPGALPRDLAALVAEVDAQRSTIAALEARLRQLEADVRNAPRRR